MEAHVVQGPSIRAIGDNSAKGVTNTGSAKAMTINSRILAIAGGMLVVLTAAQPSIAQKRGGILKMYTPDSPASMSVLEEATVFSRGPMMGVFNNLVMFDQQVKQNSLQSIMPDLATGWSWNEHGTELTFPLRQG